MTDDPIPALDLLERQMANLYRVNPHGRLDETNESPPATAPRLFVGRTRQGNRWWTRADLAEPLRHELDALCAREQPLGDREAAPVMRDALRAVLAERAPIAHEYRGPAYAAVAAVAAVTVVGPCTLVTPANAPLLRTDFPSWLAGVDACAPLFAVVQSGGAVAIGFSARRGKRAAEAGVETAGAYRNPGYGARVTAAWTAAVQAAGLTPFYGATWDTTASTRIAERLGFRLFAENWHFG